MLKILSFQKSTDTDSCACLYIGFFFPKKSLKSRRVSFASRDLNLEKNSVSFNHAFQKSSKSTAVYLLALTQMFRNNILLSTLKDGHCLAKACFVQLSKRIVCWITSMCLVMVTWVFLVSLSLKNLSTCSICLKRRLFLNMTFSEFSIYLLVIFIYSK